MHWYPALRFGAGSRRAAPRRAGGGDLLLFTAVNS